MRQSRWMEFLENYDCTINYHPGKSNVVVDTLNRKVQVTGLMIKECNMLEKVSEWNPRLECQKAIFNNITVRSTLMDWIKETQKKDSAVQKWAEKVQKGKLPDFNLNLEVILRYRNRVVLLTDEIVKKKFLEETHRSKYTVHLGSSKLYQDLKELYWWDNIKREIAQYVQTYLICQQVKAEYKKLLDLLQPLEIPEWK